MAMRFVKALAEHGLHDLLVENQAKYAIRLSEARGELTYEEMHKLFSICDEVWALTKLGLTCEEDLLERFSDSVRDRLKQEPTKARLVAEDRQEPWSRRLWWYELAMSPT
jgi:hypothetical protein